VTTPALLPRLVDLGTGALGLGLLGLSAHATFLPADASATYGVPTDGVGLAWVQAAGARDAVLGLVVLLTLRHRAVRPGILACALLLPLADLILAYLHGGGAAATLPHATGVVGIGVLLGLALAERARG
jgi:hypothetical protein